MKEIQQQQIRLNFLFEAMLRAGSMPGGGSILLKSPSNNVFPEVVFTDFRICLPEKIICSLNKLEASVRGGGKTTKSARVGSLPASLCPAWFSPSVSTPTTYEINRPFE